MKRGERTGNLYRRTSLYGGHVAGDAMLYDDYSEASDWAGRWLACGMFNRTWDNIPLDGQISFEV